MRLRAALLSSVAVIGGSATTYALVLRGTLAPDLGVGRRLRALGPIRMHVAAPRETLFDVISAPYLGRTPRAMHAKLDVLERGTDMVLAAHFTKTPWIKTTTVETVRFEPPERVSFRLVRGPVPHVTETFDLLPAAAGTDLEYRGELGTDLWRLGAWWGNLVAQSWERTVEQSLTEIRTEAERRAGAGASVDRTASGG